jgi:hypothetical protein
MVRRSDETTVTVIGPTAIRHEIEQQIEFLMRGPDDDRSFSFPARRLQLYVRG